MQLFEKIKLIEFPKQEDLEWLDWPSLPASISIPEDISFWFAGDMVQLCAIVKDSNINYLVCNKENRLGLLQSMLELIFPGKYTWYDLRCNFGIYDYFWYSQSIECGIIDIEELPSWCSSAWDILIQGKLINVFKVGNTEIYYVKNYDNLPFDLVMQVYQKIFPLFLDEIIKFQSESLNEGYITEEEYFEIVAESKATISELNNLDEDDFRRGIEELLMSGYFSQPTSD